MSWLLGLFSLIGNGVSGFFNFKSQQAEVINKAMDVVTNVSQSDDSRDRAVAEIIRAEANSESWLTRTWRPLVVMMFVALLFSFFFGYSPTNVTPEMINRVFDIVEFSVLGYMGSRGLEKIVSTLALGPAISKFIQKKLG